MTTLPSLGISGAWDYLPVVAGGILSAFFRWSASCSAWPLSDDDILDELTPAGVTAELDGRECEGLRHGSLILSASLPCHVIGTPIAFCLGVSSFATVLYMGCRR